MKSFLTTPNTLSALILANLNKVKLGPFYHELFAVVVVGIILASLLS